MKKIKIAQIGAGHDHATAAITTIKFQKDIYDFRGVSGVLDETHPQYGLYRFKKGFNAEFTEFIGEIYFDFKPFVYKTYKVSEKIFKKTRGFIRRLKGEVKWNH